MPSTAARSSRVLSAFGVAATIASSLSENFEKSDQVLPVRFSPADGSPPSVAQLLQVAEEGPQEGNQGYWSKWTTDYDYVYVLFTDPSYENPDPTRLTTVFTGNRFALFRINPTDTQPGPKIADTRGDLAPAR